jgi:glycosyltransferase involved in cell wall biosynthesis
MKQISVVMPSLNEEANLGEAVADVLAAFKDLKLDGEILVVNDGSSDGTAELARALEKKHPEVRALHHEATQGIGAAFWSGVKLASGEAVTMLPGDGENDAREILLYLPLLQRVDIVIPFVFNGEIRSLLRRLLSKIYKTIINLSFGVLVNYMNGTVMYRRSALLTLKHQSTGFFYQTELLIRAIRKGYLYAEVPYALKLRRKGRSKALTARSLWRVSREYLGMLWAVYLDKEAAPGVGIHPETVTARRRKIFSK